MSITRLDSAASAAASTLAYSVSAGSDRLLVVAISGEWDPGASDDDVTAVDYGGQAMVKVRFELGFVSGNSIGSSIWYLLDAGIAAASGTTITPTFANPANQSDPMIAAASYAGAKQDSGVVIEQKGDNVVGASPDPITTVDLVESSGNLIVAAGAIGEPLPEGVVSSWSAAMTEQTDQLAASAATSLADRLSTTEVNQDIELNWVGPVNRQAIVSVHFAQVGGPPPPESCLSEVSATGSSTSSATAYELISGMTLTPGGGDYLAWFTASVNADDGLPESIFIALFVNGVIVSHTEREIHFDTSMEGTTFLLAATHALVQPTDGQTVEVRWRVTSGATTMTVLQRTLNLIKLEAADVDEATATGNDTTTSTSYTQVGSMILTPGAGKFILFFTCSAEGDGEGDDVRFAVFVNGVIVQHTERSWNQESSITDSEFCYAIAAEINPAAGQDVEIRWFVEGGIGTVHERTLTLWKTEQIEEVSATADTTTTSASFVDLDSMEITPVADEYLAIFSGYWEGSLSSAHDLDAAIVEAGSEIAHTQRTSGSDGSTPAMDHCVASNGIVNVNGSQAVEVHWRRSNGGTATCHERTLILISCLAVVDKDAVDNLDIDLVEIAEVSVIIEPADQLDIDLGEDAELFGLIGPADQLDIDLGEVAAGEVDGAAQDDLALAVDEQADLLAAAEPLDILDINLVEEAEVAVIIEALDVLDLDLDELAEVVFSITLIEASDGLDISLDEVAEVIAGIQASDDLDLSVDEIAEVLAAIQVSDQLDLEIDETAEIAATVSAIDNLDISLDELAEIAAVVQASDVLDLDIDDNGQVSVEIAVSDTLDLAISELVELLGLIGVTDSLDIEIQDATQILALISRSDTLDLAIDDQGKVAVQVTAEDTIDLAIDEVEAQVVVGIIAQDTLNLAIVEASQLLAFMDRAESLDIALVEGAPVIFVQGSADDTLGIDLVELADLNVPIQASDVLDLVTEDVASVVAALTASDQLDLSLDEQAQVLVVLDALDQLDLDLAEQGDVAVMVDALDQLDLAIDETAEIAAVLTAADQLDISIGEVAQILRAIAAVDSLGLEISDTGTVEILAPFEGIIVQPFILTVCRELRFELTVCREVRFTLQIEGSGVQTP